MKTEEAKQLAKKAIDELALAVADGHSESLTAYLAAMARFHRYSLGNTLLIAMANPDATHVAGYRAWQRLGRQVRQGERGISILAPIWVRPPPQHGKRSTTGDLAQEATTGGLSDIPHETVVSFKCTTVFDISQTDGAPLPEFATVCGEPSVCLDRLEAFIASRGICLKRTRLRNGALGMSTGGTILLRGDLTPAETFATLVHETAHELLHQGDAGLKLSRTIRETEAEAVAFVVCKGVGLETTTASSDYIQLYDGTKETLLVSLERIRTTAGEILAAIDAPPQQMAKGIGADRRVDSCVSGGLPAKRIGSV